MQSITKTRTGLSTRKSGITVYTRRLKLTKYLSIDFASKVAVSLLFVLAVSGITGFTIIWFDSLLTTTGNNAFILLPFLIGINILNGIIAVKGFLILKNYNRGKIL